MKESITTVFFTFTEDILEEADAMQKQGFSLQEIADRFGCDKNSLKTTLSKWRNGKWKGRSEKQKEVEDYVEYGVMSGWPAKMLAFLLGMSLQQLSAIFRRMGWDKENRGEYQ